MFEPKIQGSRAGPLTKPTPRASSMSENAGPYLPWLQGASIAPPLQPSSKINVAAGAKEAPLPTRTITVVRHDVETVYTLTVPVPCTVRTLQKRIFEETQGLVRRVSVMDPRDQSKLQLDDSVDAHDLVEIVCDDTAEEVNEARKKVEKRKGCKMQ